MTKVFTEPLNQGRFETWTFRPEGELLQVHQVHGTDLVSPETLPCEADGLVCSWEDIKHPLAIKTADCLPIVVEGETGVVFLHAGWRGLADGILKRPELALIKPLRAYIGPSIHVCCFEVSPDFRSNFPESPHFRERDGKLFFDLTEEAKRVLRISFPNLLVTSAPVCTCCHPEYHSFRRNKTKERNWNLYIKG
jgi:copper oxidase (laccase) domain-containing protein